ncbi:MULTISPECIES: hypothetical protein [unclassified Pseudomonas]|uniref:hypothetical protein n=1 Tax=unclassified Pseudomonas TaxID=196821 RepID=UPI000D93555B|nr:MULTISPECIES: hypothetical protein [unclassified Pseudomonas]PYG79829.1 hypothetical protein N428_02154 [Pseudomonas sp. RV120224-01c]PYG83667.1 hypothetical protein N436_02018 [Pseudomonas sp. RV120224-01b]
MDEIENPFEELHGLMQAAVAMSPGHKTLDVWASVLKCSASNSIEVAKGLNRVILLMERSRKAITFIPGDRERFVTPIQQLETLFESQNLTNLWSDYRSYLDASTLTALDFGAYALSQFSPGSSPEKSVAIRQYIEKLDNLLAEALEADLSDPIKKLFIKHLEALRTALLRYKVEGPEVLEAALDGAIGALHRNGASIRDEPEQGQELFHRFWDMLSKVNDLASGAENATALLGFVSPLLLPLIANSI